jgi:hypothetical protein
MSLTISNRQEFYRYADGKTPGRYVYHLSFEMGGMPFLREVECIHPEAARRELMEWEANIIDPPVVTTRKRAA